MPTKQYVKKLNGFYVKDEEARGGIDALNADVEDIKNSATYVFPGRWGEDQLSGNSNLVIADGKTILFDTNSSYQYSYLEALLADNNVTHLDYVIISHFDADHYGNFVNLVNDGYIDSDTKYYHGLFSDVFYSSRTAYEEIEAVCVEHNIASVVPEDLSVITDGKISFKFGNTNIEYAEEHYTNANEASMVVQFTHKNSSALFMGDALWRAEQYLYENNFVDRQIDLYCIPHHAIEKTCHAEFVKTVSPKIAFAQTQFQDYRKNKISRNKESAILKELGAELYYSFAHEQNPKFVEVNGSITCINARVDGSVGMELTTTNTYYVDANTDNTVQNGMQETPFKDLPQALGKIGAIRNASIVVRLAAGTYGTLNTVDMLKNQIPAINFPELLIIGNSAADTIIDQGVLAHNCNLTLRDLTINVNDTDNAAIKTAYSNVTIRDCIITNTRESEGATGFLLEGNSAAVLLNVSINGVDTGIEQHAGTCDVTGLSANGVTDLFSLSSTSSVNIYTLAELTNVTNVFRNSNGIANIKQASQNVTQSESVSTISLNQSNKMYKRLHLRYVLMYNGQNYGTFESDFDYEAGTGRVLSAQALRASDSELYGATATLTIADGSIQITRNGAYKQDTSGITFNAGSSENMNYGIKITKVEYEKG